VGGRVTKTAGYRPIVSLAVSVRLSHVAVGLSSSPRFCRIIEMFAVASEQAKLLSNCRSRLITEDANFTLLQYSKAVL
jgi:hypothetical protein